MVVEEPVRGSFAYLERPGLFATPAIEQLRLFARRPAGTAPPTRG